ncbi:MAG: hypothetical protein ABIN58_03805 [candidate division WOR-3 bacterium]
MKIAIPLFGQSVSPHFSTAPEVLVVTFDGRKVGSASRLEFSKLSLVGKRRKLIGIGIERLICGGIDCVTKGWFEERGVRVTENVMGDAMEAVQRLLTAWAEGELTAHDPVRVGREHDETPGGENPKGCGVRDAGRCSAEQVVYEGGPL